MRAVLRPATGVLLAGVLGLTGCGIGDGVSEKAGQKATEKLLEKAAESDGEDLDVDLDGEKITVESSEGTFSLGGGEVPEGFPSQVPLVDGEVAMAAGGAEGWSLMLKVPGALADVAEEAVTKVLAAGFTEAGRTTTAEFVAVSAEGDEFEVMVAVTAEEPEVSTVQYTVTPR